MMRKLAGGERNVAGEFSWSYGSSFGEISMRVAASVALFPVLPDQKLPVRPNFSFSANVSLIEVSYFRVLFRFLLDGF